ncbi:hypothetical protein [Brucella pseudintermedia]|uniref:hypothetical protein n=1 Tax=Brucella pseudintermedia TaxID=370111 RepID=UPI0032099616
MASETFADELRAAVAGDKRTLYTELMLQAAELLDEKNTRPAPSATDTGLETVAWQDFVPSTGWVASSPSSIAKDKRELVTRSQAEELLAAKDARIAAIEADNAAEREKGIVQAKRAELTELKERWLKEMVTAITSSPIGSPKHLRAVEYARRALNSPEASLYALYEKEELIQRVEKAEADNAALIHDLNRIKDHETELVNDNAEKDARIKKLEEALDSDPSGSDLWRYWSRKACEASQKYVDEVNRAEALEAKLAAAEKALEPFANAADGRKSKNVTGSVCFSQHYLLAARAVLGGDPS